MDFQLFDSEFERGGIFVRQCGKLHERQFRCDTMPSERKRARNGKPSTALFYQDALAPPPPDIPPPPQELPLQELLVQEWPLCGKPVAKTWPKPLRNLPFLPPFIGRSIKIKMMMTKIINGEK